MRSEKIRKWWRPIDFERRFQAELKDFYRVHLISFSSFAQLAYAIRNNE